MMYKKFLGLFFFVGTLSSTALPMAGRTPLHQAAQAGNFLQLHHLLAGNNADVNAKDNFGWTPLHHAAYWDRVECVKVLLNAGASPEEKTNEGGTAKILAQEGGYKDIVALLEDYESIPDVKEPEAN